MHALISTWIKHYWLLKQTLKYFAGQDPPEPLDEIPAMVMEIVGEDNPYFRGVEGGIDASKSRRTLGVPTKRRVMGPLMIP